MAVPQPSPEPNFGAVIIAIGCGVGALVGGLVDGWLNARGSLLSAPGIMVGIVFGGLLASVLVDVGRPAARLIRALRPAPQGAPAAVAEAVASTPAGKPALDPNRPSLTGRLVQLVLALAVACLALFTTRLVARPMAEFLGMAPIWPALVMTAIGVVTAILAWRIGAALARHLDLTAE